MLRAALENNPHMVMNVFMNISDSADEAAAYRENGLLHRINGVINTYMGGSAQTSLDILETSIYNATKKVDDFEEKMTGLQEKYYLKYAALENAMAQLQSQTNWLAAMLGSTSS